MERGREAVERKNSLHYSCERGEGEESGEEVFLMCVRKCLLFIGERERGRVEGEEEMAKRRGLEEKRGEREGREGERDEALVKNYLAFLPCERGEKIVTDGEGDDRKGRSGGIGNGEEALRMGAKEVSGARENYCLCVR